MGEIQRQKIIGGLVLLALIATMILVSKITQGQRYDDSKVVLPEATDIYPDLQNMADIKLNLLYECNERDDKYDTIPAIILMCDTTSHTWSTMVDWDTGETVELKSQNYTVFWIYGYEIVKTRYIPYEPYQLVIDGLGNVVTHYESTSVAGYLDEYKDELESTVVWMTKRR